MAKHANLKCYCDITGTELEDLESGPVMQLNLTSAAQGSAQACEKGDGAFRRMQGRGFDTAPMTKICFGRSEATSRLT